VSVDDSSGNTHPWTQLFSALTPPAQPLPSTCEKNPDLYGFSEGTAQVLRTLSPRGSETVQTIRLPVIQEVEPTHQPVCIDNTILNEVFHGCQQISIADAGIGVFGKGETAENVRITHINGIMNNLCHCISSASLISQLHGCVNVHYVHRPTIGLFQDLWDTLLSEFGLISEQARYLACVWKQMIAEMNQDPSKCKIYHFAHSSGGVETRNAAQLITAEERAILNVSVFGSPIILDKNGFGSVHNFVSLRDGVGLFGILTNPLALPNVSFVGSLSGIPFIDHLFAGETYTQVISQLGSQFVWQFGSLVDNISSLWEITSAAQLQVFNERD
jgi:hypothetical protein